MMSSMCEKAIGEINHYGKALLKYISPNDVGSTNSHQYGYYLPKSIAKIFTPYLPDKGANSKHNVNILWPDGNTTESCITWYGTGTRSEYRLTKFGRDFIWRNPENVGNLLVLIPKTISDFNAYVLNNENDIEELQSALGVEVLDSWLIYEKGITQPEIEDNCLRSHFINFVNSIYSFPQVIVFSRATQEALLDCVSNFEKMTLDERLVCLIREEYSLFKMAEYKIYGPEVTRLFSSIDDFIGAALKILNARKSRAGRSLENQVDYLFTKAGLPHEMRQEVDGTKPDILIPGKDEYLNNNYPLNKLFVIGIKTTCKDRWRQILAEAPRVENKHILTIQAGISSKQLDEMKRANVTLIIPQELHKLYPTEFYSMIFSLEAFINSVKEAISQ